MLCGVTLGHQMSDRMSAWPKGSSNVKLTWHSTALGHQMLLLGVCLTECQPDPKAHQMSRWPDVVLLLATTCLYWFGVKTFKIAWDLCSSPPCIPFYPYTMFENSVPKPSCQNSRKTNITQKVLVTQSSNIVHCNWHTQRPICANFQAFLNTFPCWNWCFFIFCLREFSKQPNISHFVDCDWEKCIEMAWVVHL